VEAPGIYAGVGVSTFSESKACDLSRKSSLPLGFCFVSGHDFSRAIEAENDEGF
jgi:hypothetical protein